MLGLNRVQVAILFFIGKEVILEGSAIVLSGDLASSLPTIHLDVSTLSPSSVVIAAVVRRLVCLVPVQVVLGAHTSTVRDVLGILLAHSNQILHFQPTCHSHHLVLLLHLLESFIHVCDVHVSAGISGVVLLARLVVARETGSGGVVCDVTASCLVHEVVLVAYVLLMTGWQSQWLLTVVRWRR